MREAAVRRAAALLLAAAATAGTAADDAPAFRHAAPIDVERSAAYVQLALPASTWGRALRPGLADLRVVDADGQRVPFALLEPRAPQSQPQREERAAALYALPPRPADGSAWPSPLDLQIDGDRVRLRRPALAPKPAATPGWLVDLGPPRPGDPAERSLRLAWPAGSAFSAAFTLDASDDLRRWRPAGGGQLLALGGAAGPLAQPEVPLSGAPARFVRLAWLDPAAAPLLTGAMLQLSLPRPVSPDPPTTLHLAPLAAAGAVTGAEGGLQFDLGGVLPLLTMSLQWPGGTHVAPVRLQGRDRAGEPWRELGAAVFYRLEREAEVAAPPPQPLPVRLRYLRVQADERAAPLPPDTRLVVQAALPTLVFAAQGRPPYRLLAGASDAAPGALPAATLVPALEAERPRFGQATLGAWQDDADALRRAAEQERLAAWRPRLLWALLLAGVAGLGWVVWRLARRG